MPDFDAINTALAARFAAAAITPPTGYDNVKISTGDLPTAMLPLPAVLVFPQSGDFTHYPGKRDSIHEYVVRFYYNQAGDLERDMAALRKWLTVLVDQLKLSTQLSGNVTLATVDSWTVGILEYTPNTYTGIELTCHVVVNEAWAAVA
ncbi:MAG TPA: hypothetical protein VJN72_12590 [Gaiellales bacterium]|nr:hypothetical protein [Gaiellales bacterium]